MKIRAAQFEVTYTRGDTLATETQVLVGTIIRELGCGCLRVRFDRPGGALAEHDGTGLMEAYAGAECSWGHRAECREVDER